MADIMPPVEETITEYAHELGFDFIGFTTPAPSPHAQQFQEWIKAGLHGDLHWIERNAAKRLNPITAFPGMTSIIVLGMNYYPGDIPEELAQDPSRGRIARYAWGPDYHDVLRPRLHKLAGFMKKITHSNIITRVAVDTAPLMERELGQRAGLGFIGRNGMLINPRFGSWFFLGEILTDLELNPDSQTIAPACDECRLCINSCPAAALRNNGLLDCRRCLSCLTIESRSLIPEAVRPLLGNRIFGCDVCQEVCPWNGAARPADPEHAFLAFDPSRDTPRLTELALLTPAQFREIYGKTPLQHAGWERVLRNVAVALGNWDSREARKTLEYLAREQMPPLVREQARAVLKQ